VSFLLLASVPALLLTLIANRRISGALDRLQNPGVEASLSRSAVLSRELVRQLSRDAERLFAELPLDAPAGEDEPAIERLLEAAGFDYAAWELSESGTRIVRNPAAAPADLEGPGRWDWRRLARGSTPELLAGRSLRFFGEGAPSPDGRALGRAVGRTVAEDIATALASAGDDYARYLQLSLFEEIQKRMVWLTSAGIFLLTAGAAFLAARITARRISGPVVRLAHAADRLAAGELSHRADVRGDGEIGDLVVAFNRMGAELERSREELLRVERIAAWRDVARRVAHEVRNPLTPMKLALHRLEARVPREDDSRECLHSIAEEIDNLQRIATAFSDFAKMPEASFARTDLAQIARSVLELNQDAPRGIEVRYEGPESLPLVADRDQLRRAVTNLLKNAVEALAAGGTVTVRLARGAASAVLAVEDDGPGIPEAIRETLFRPGVSGKPGGSGLGLSMVQRIATDHRGALKWEPRHPGTRFVLEIPLDLAETE
jgi:nitrogen fixation/metabolism regulation signal transduction histidine kinase